MKKLLLASMIAIASAFAIVASTERSVLAAGRSRRRSAAVRSARRCGTRSGTLSPRPRSG